MLFACDATEGGYPFGEVAQTVIGGKPATARVDLSLAVRFLEPRDEMFDYTLVQLVEDVGGDRVEDIRIRKLFPERMEKGFDSGILAGTGECARPIVEGGEGIENVCEISKGSGGVC